MLQIAHIAFENIFGLSGIIPERYFHVAAQKLYGVNPIANTGEEAEFMPLFCGIMTLGSLCQSGTEPKSHNDLSERYVESPSTPLSSLLKKISQLALL